MNDRLLAPVCALAGLVLAACSTTPRPAPRTEAPPASPAVSYAAKGERVEDFGALVPAHEVAPTTVRLERVSAGVPWPRGLAWVDGELVVLARGRHRNAGGVDHSIEDHTGHLYRVDPEVSEPVVRDQLAGAAVTANAGILARPDGSLFYLPDRSLDPAADTRMDRPYCTLIWDEASRNVFICGFSGVDLPERKFRKNATDSIHRYDLRTGRWYGVELHDASVVPTDQLGYVVSNEYYPHHDPRTNPPPHGWLNGPDGGCVAGRYLYCAAKDNHVVVQYDLDAVRRDPEAGPPPSRPVLGSRVTVRHPVGERSMEVLGPSTAVARDGWLYVGYRTSSVVLRFPIEDDGALVEPAVGELIAVFEPWDAERGRSANLIDMAFNSRGELFVSCSQEGRVWKVGRPDPVRPFYGNDQGPRPTSAPPFLDLAELTGKRTSIGNILFDPEDRLYICAGTYDTNSSQIAGVIYRAVETPNS